MTFVKRVPDDKTLRDVAVLNYLLSKPTGDPIRDAENAALIEERNAAIRDGKAIYASIPDCYITRQARQQLGQATGLV